MDDDTLIELYGAILEHFEGDALRNEIHRILSELHINDAEAESWILAEKLWRLK